jgi:hypothetical protein
MNSSQQNLLARNGSEWREITALDRLARSMAEATGVNWERLHNHPGYEKNLWRDLAQNLVNSTELYGLRRQ